MRRLSTMALHPLVPMSPPATPTPTCPYFAEGGAMAAHKQLFNLPTWRGAVRRAGAGRRHHGRPHPADRETVAAEVEAARAATPPKV